MQSLSNSKRQNLFNSTEFCTIYSRLQPWVCNTHYSKEMREVYSRSDIDIFSSEKLISTHYSLIFQLFFMKHIVSHNTHEKMNFKQVAMIICNVQHSFSNTHFCLLSRFENHRQKSLTISNIRLQERKCGRLPDVPLDETFMIQA